MKKLVTRLQAVNYFFDCDIIDILDILDILDHSKTERSQLMSTIHNIDRDSVVIVNDTYPELELSCHYFITENDKVSFSIASLNELDLRSTGRKVKFSLSIYMDEIFGTDDFAFEDGKAYLRSFKPSDKYEFSLSDLDTMDHELAEIYEFIDSHLATANSSSTYTLTANIL